MEISGRGSFSSASENCILYTICDFIIYCIFIHVNTFWRIFRTLEHSTKNAFAICSKFPKPFFVSFFGRFWRAPWGFSPPFSAFRPLRRSRSEKRLRRDLHNERSNSACLFFHQGELRCARKDAPRESDRCSVRAARGLIALFHSVVGHFRLVKHRRDQTSCKPV